MKQKLDIILENISAWSLKWLIIFGVVFWVAVILVSIVNLFTDDIVGYTEHGTAVYESELEEE